MLDQLLAKFHGTPVSTPSVSRDRAFEIAAQIDADEAAGASMRQTRDAAASRVDTLRGELADAIAELSLQHHRVATFNQSIDRRRIASDQLIEASADPRIDQAISALRERKDSLSREFNYGGLVVPTGNFHGPSFVATDGCLNWRSVQARANEITEAIEHLGELKFSGIEGDELELHIVGTIADLLGPVPTRDIEGVHDAIGSR